MLSNDELPDVEFDIPSCVEHGEFDLSCSDCVALLPELTATEKASMSSLGEDFIPRLFLATAIAEDLVEKDLIPEDATSNVASAICSYLNKRVLVKSTLATGDEPIDESWLREIGFRVVSRWPHAVTAKEHPMFQHHSGISFIPETGEWTIGNRFIKKQETRRQLLALLSALGIEVKHAS